MCALTVLFVVVTVLFVPCSQAAAGGLVAYEGMGPAGISVMVECITDNKSRTAPKLRAIFAKRGYCLP